MQVEQTHYISVTSVKATAGQLLMNCVCLGETEQIGYVVQKGDAIEHNGTEWEVIKASRAKGEWV